MSEYVTENDYAFAEGTEGELYIYLSAKTGIAQNPQIIYDGGEHAVFMRSNEQHIILDYINPQIRDKLRKSQTIIIVETNLENINACYSANVKIVDKIPVDWAKIGLKTWEEISLKK